MIYYTISNNWTVHEHYTHTPLFRTVVKVVCILALVAVMIGGFLIANMVYGG